MPLNPQYDADFKRLYDQYHRKLVKFAESFITDPGNVVQEIYVKIHLKKDQIDISHPEQLEGLLFTMVHNQCIDEIRKDITRKKAQLAYGELADPNDPSFLQTAELEAQTMDRLDVVMSEYKQLPKASRRVIKSVFLDEMDMDEYARRHGIKLQSGHNLKNRALEKMRKGSQNRGLDIWLIIMSFLN